MYGKLYELVIINYFNKLKIVILRYLLLYYFTLINNVRYNIDMIAFRY